MLRQPGLATAKQQRHEIDGQEDTLWTRLQQLDPRWKRRSKGGPKQDAITLTAKQFLFKGERQLRAKVEHVTG